MFDSLSNSFAKILGGLRGKATLTEADVDAALRETQQALLGADVALSVARPFIESVRARAVGQTVLRSVSPGQLVVKIVHDALVEMLGGDTADDPGMALGGEPPVVVMLVGLQGAGKTTTAAKLALRFRDHDRKKTLMASLDVARPAAQEQLRILGEQSGIATLPVISGQGPTDIARRAVQAGRLSGYDVVLLDTAGRLHIDDALMREAVAVRDVAHPAEILLVADAMTGQDAAVIAAGFRDQIGVTGVILTRVDGDARGGAALSMRRVAERPIRFIGVGEKLDALEVFHPDRAARRLLGMGDVVSLVEKAQEGIAVEDAAALEEKIRKGRFDLEDMRSQLSQMRRMGGMEGLLKLLPGAARAREQMAVSRIDEALLRRQEAIIGSMTPTERRNPVVIYASRKRRIAAGAGVSIQEVNKLLKQHQTMAKMMKQVGKLGEKKFLRSLNTPSAFGRSR